jgi:hypothetical protein
MRMKPNHIDQLLAMVPSDISADQRRRLDAYVATVRHCEAHIQRLRAELPSAFHSGLGALGAVDSDGMAAPAKALAVFTELDTLERVQPRVDDWLKQYVTLLTTRPYLDAYGDA